MDLTKKQLQFIDYRLEEEGILFWDIRMEMLDHVVCHIETMQEQKNFKKALQEAFVKLGWKENFNGGGFTHMMTNISKQYGKKTRTRWIDFVKTSVRKPITIVFGLLFLGYLYTFRHDKIMLQIPLALFLLHSSFAVFFLLYKYQICKSMQLAQALSLATLSLSLFNFFLFVPKIFLPIDTFTNPTYIAVLLLFKFPLQVLGTQFFWNEYQEVSKIHQHLIQN